LCFEHSWASNSGADLKKSKKPKKAEPQSAKASEESENEMMEASGLKGEMDELVIDPSKNWKFKSESELYDFFKDDIDALETKFKDLIDQSTQPKKQSLEFTLDDPDEVWERTDLFSDERPLYTFIKNFGKKTEVAFCHLFEKEPVFIYSHFTLPNEVDLNDLKFEYLVRDGNMSEVFKGALDGDSLNEGDELAVGLYKAMLTLRGEDDFKEEEFEDFIEVREQTIEEADEIWRSMDSYGNYLVHFIKEYELEESDETFHYIATTVEDEASDSNVLLFSFPTKDKGLVERYRSGENMQAEEVTQEGSH
jgi:hypothetical protein